VLASTALLVSVVALGLAAGALARANSGSSPAASAATAPSPTDTGGSTDTDLPTETLPPTDLPTSDSASPDDTGLVIPTGDFTVAYTRQLLRVQPVCDPLRYVDLDEPRVSSVEEGTEEPTAEFDYGCSYTPPKMDFDTSVQIATVPSPNATARDCAEAIRSGPTSSPVVPTGELNLCIITSAAEADQEGIEQKIVRLTVTSVAKDYTVNIQVTAWNVPR
jgi:hypothetical protein